MAADPWTDGLPRPGEAARPEAKAGLRIGFADPEGHRVTIDLQYPLEIEGERVEALTVHRLTAGEMVRIVEGENAPKSDEDLIRHVTAAMIGWPIEVLDALAPDDAGRLAEAALPFFTAGLVAAIARADAAQEAVNTADAAA